MLKTLKNFYLNCNLFLFIIVNWLILIVLLTIPFESLNTIFHFKDNINDSYLNHLDSVTLFILAIFIAPLFETFFFQYGIIKSFVYFNPKTRNTAIFLSSLLFSLNHWYGLVYVVYTFLLGILFGILYFTSEKRGFKPFWVIVAVHSLYNLTVFVFNEFSIK